MVMVPAPVTVTVTVTVPVTGTLPRSPASPAALATRLYSSDSSGPQPLDDATTPEERETPSDTEEGGALSSAPTSATTAVGTRATAAP